MAKAKSTQVITVEQVELYRSVVAQVASLLEEIRELSKKKPDDPVNKFKLGFVNEKLDDANTVLGPNWRPLKKFETFDVDALPSNSDVVLILSQYAGALSRWKSDHTYRDAMMTYWWNTSPAIEVK